MLTKMILKMLFKVSIPLVCMVGLMSYGTYMRGGDPGAILKKIAGGTLQSAKSSVQGAGDSLQSMAPLSVSSSKTTVYKWVDEHGSVQFGSSPPEGVNATAKTYDNNANLMAGTPLQNDQETTTHAQAAVGPDGQPLPGVAGMNLPVAVDPAVLAEFLETMQQQQ